MATGMIKHLRFKFRVKPSNHLQLKKLSKISTGETLNQPQSQKQIEPFKN